jgi:DNA-directed RNA polymerase subunit RPC12/RpoP
MQANCSGEKVFEVTFRKRLFKVVVLHPTKDKSGWKHLKADDLQCRKRRTLLEKSSGIVYECVRCGSKVPSEELELRGGEIKCIICGYRILKKTKPPVVKRIPAK